MDSKDYKELYLIHKDVLPESVVRTFKIKGTLKDDPILPVYETAKQFNLSRSTFYKYRNIISPVDDKTFEHHKFTLILYVNDIIRTLAQVLQIISKLALSVLTIRQSVPMREKATITLSLGAGDQLLSIEKVMGILRNVQHIHKVELISMSMQGRYLCTLT